MGLARVVCLGATALAVATAAHGAAPPLQTGGLRFGPATFADPLRVVSAPVLRSDAGGGLWLTGSAGTLARSTDGGDSFRPTTPPPVGAGTADVVEAGPTVVVAAADGGRVTVAGSDDGGSTWRAGTAGPPGQETRPWLAADGATVFLAVTRPAGTDILSADARDLVFEDAGAPGPESPSTRCGRLVFDPVRRNLYLPCARGNTLQVTTGRVEPGRRTGISFATGNTTTTPVGPVAGPLPTLAVDAAGDPYLVWVDAGTSSLYASRPSSSPVLINGAGADVAALPVAVGGAPGRFAVAFLGAETDREPSTLPDVRSDPGGAAAVRWYGYVSLVSDLTASSAAVVQQRTTAKPVAFGRICTTCATDPLLGDTIGVALEPGTGAVRIALPDASDPQHAPQPVLVRQLAGPTPLGQSVSKQAPQNGVIDGIGEAPEAAHLDLTKLELQQVNPSTLRVRMTVAGRATPAPPPGAASAVWLTRFQILSRGRAGEPAYRSLYAAAVGTGAQPAFAAGEILCEVVCRLSPRTATGRLEGSSVIVDVNLSSLSASVPLEGDLLYNVSGFTFGGDESGNPVTMIDSLASFDYRLDQRIGPTTGRGRHITLRGAIRGGTATVDVFTNRTGRVSYRDARTRIAFRSTRITRATVRAGTATISGRGLNGARTVSFVATVTDRGAGRRDSFGLRLSSGYRKSGRLTSGNAVIR